VRQWCTLGAVLIATLALACGDDSSVGAGGAGGAGGAPDRDFTAGADRPVTVRVPPSYRDGVPAPLVILLHGYGATGFLEDTYLELGDASVARGAIFAAPDGTLDAEMRQFWNATDACCDFGDVAVDDSAYLLGLVDEIATHVDVDPKRVYFVGHSNGAFMSHRMACDHADRVTAIASLAGAVDLDPAACGATEPVSVLQIHGTADDTVLYDGGDNLGTSAGFPASSPYPGVEATIATWVGIDGCDSAPASGAPLDLDVYLDGDETTVSTYSGCAGGSVVELWAIQGGSHIPTFYYYVTDDILDFLFARSK
jgi:polyhydroxybutyrate depolymerase